MNEDLKQEELVKVYQLILLDDYEKLDIQFKDLLLTKPVKINTIINIKETKKYLQNSLGDAYQLILSFPEVFLEKDLDEAIRYFARLFKLLLRLRECIIATQNLNLGLSCSGEDEIGDLESQIMEDENLRDIRMSIEAKMEQLNNIKRKKGMS